MFESASTPAARQTTLFGDSPLTVAMPAGRVAPAAGRHRAPSADPRKFMTASAFTYVGKHRVYSR